MKNRFSAFSTAAALIFAGTAHADMLSDAAGHDPKFDKIQSVLNLSVSNAPTLKNQCTWWWSTAFDKIADRSGMPTTLEKLGFKHDVWIDLRALDAKARTGSIKTMTASETFEQATKRVRVCSEALTFGRKTLTDSWSGIEQFKNEEVSRVLLPHMNEYVDNNSSSASSAEAVRFNSDGSVSFNFVNLFATYDPKTHWFSVYSGVGGDLLLVHQFEQYITLTWTH